VKSRLEDRVEHRAKDPDAIICSLERHAAFDRLNAAMTTGLRSPEMTAPRRIVDAGGANVCLDQRNGGIRRIG
jgi:hypothetical protein